MDGIFFSGDGWLICIIDVVCSVCWENFKVIVSLWKYDGGIKFMFVDNVDGKGFNVIIYEKDVLFYFMGLIMVFDIEINSYCFGVIVDYFILFGGKIFSGS